MVTNTELFGPEQSRAFSPYLAPNERQHLREVIDFTGKPVPGFADELRTLARRYVDDGDSLKLRAVCLLVADLFEQGWQINTTGGGISFAPPGLTRAGAETIDDIKIRVRSALQSARRRQLAEPSVRKFLERTERRRPRGTAAVASIHDLIDHGADLARHFRLLNDLPADERKVGIAALVDPVIEICEAGVRCADTGLPLIDIWRYFRHTWAHEYRSIPDRKSVV